MTPSPTAPPAAVVPFLDLGRLHATIADDLTAAMVRTVETSALVGGPALDRFEAAFAAAHGAVGSAGCGSGTDALVLALRACGIGPGDEVVVPAMTFVATAEAVALAGADVVLADVDPVTLLLTPETVAAVTTPRTRAVLPVHLYGHTVPFDHLQTWRDAGLVVVEDAAQAHLATWAGRPVGSVGHATGFSFYPGKNLGALGDGGAVMAHDPAVLDEVRRLRDHGSTRKYHHEVLGHCSRLDGIQAAVLEVKLAHLAGWTEARRRLARRYRDRLGDLLVPWEEGAVHHLLVARVDPAARAGIQDELLRRGVQTALHYPIALSDQPALAAVARPCPAAEAGAASVLSLPMDPLMGEDEVERVADAVLAVV